MNPSQTSLQLLPSARRLAFPASVEKLFLKDYFHNSLGSCRASLVVAFLLYAVFGILDFWGIPSAKHYVWTIRYAIVCPVIAAALLLSFLPIFERVMQLAAGIVVTTAGLGIVAMIAATRPGDPAYAHYYAGLILVVVFGFTFVRLRLRYAIVATGIVIAAYEVVAVSCQKILAQEYGVPQFLNSNFFLIAANILGIASGYFLEFYMRKDFLQRNVIESELAAAREIQQSLLPRTPPSIPGVSIAGTCRTSLQVGGDYFDVVPAARDEWTFVVADVSGKGAAAALLMANLHAIIRTCPAERGLLETAALINSHVSGLMQQARYVTAILARYETSTRTLNCLNAGHSGGILVGPDGAVEKIESTGFPLGLFEDGHWEVQRVVMNPGSILLLYTDGIVDRENSAGESYDEERLLKAALKHAASPSARMLGGILDDNDRFAGGVPAADDSTLLIVRVEPEQEPTGACDTGHCARTPVALT